MDKLRHCFGEIDMTWKRVIILALITGIYTGIVAQIDILEETSFQDIAITFEAWILFAVFIISNCKSWKEAAIKCFIFFLISQPLVYLVQVPRSGFELFNYYPYWLGMTILTIPGAIIAYQIKRGNLLSALVLSVANGFLAYMTVVYARSVMTDFPHHLLSAIFCIVLALAFIWIFLKDKKSKALALIVIVAVMAVTAFWTFNNSYALVNLPEGEWTYSIEDDNIVNVELTAEDQLKISARSDGGTYVWAKADGGEEREFYVSVTGGNVYVSDLSDL